MKKIRRKKGNYIVSNNSGKLLYSSVADAINQQKCILGVECFLLPI